MLVTLFVSTATAVLASSKQGLGDSVGISNGSPLSVLTFQGFLFQYEAFPSTTIPNDTMSEITISAGSATIIDPNNHDATVLSIRLSGDGATSQAGTCYHCGRCSFGAPALSSDGRRGIMYGSDSNLNEAVWRQIPQDSAVTFSMNRRRIVVEPGLTCQPLSLSFVVGVLSIVFAEQVLIDHTILFLLSPFPSLLEADPSVRTVTRRLHKVTNTLSSLDLAVRVSRLLLVFPPERGGGPALLFSGAVEHRPIFVDLGHVDVRLDPRSLWSTTESGEGSLPQLFYSVLEEHGWPASQSQARAVATSTPALTTAHLPVLRVSLSRRAANAAPPVAVIRLESENRLLRQREATAMADIATLSDTVCALRALLNASAEDPTSNGRSGAISWRSGKRSPPPDVESGYKDAERGRGVGAQANVHSFWDRLWMRGRPVVVLYLVLLHVALPYFLLHLMRQGSVEVPPGVE